MFFFGPHDRQGIDDFRSSVHDSEGLAIWNGREEWLAVAASIRTPFRRVYSSMPTHAASGWCSVAELLLIIRISKPAMSAVRASGWSPLGDWGQGAVQLVEIPSKSESNDNIVAFIRNTLSRLTWNTAARIVCTGAGRHPWSPRRRSRQRRERALGRSQMSLHH